jgi:cyclopropane-fatty-acyl-phospholipid synthase
MTENVSAAISDAVEHRSFLGRGIVRAIDAALIRALVRRVGADFSGTLRVIMPSGREALVGRGGDREATLEIVRYRALFACAMRGFVGFADSFANGDIDTPSLTDLFELYQANAGMLGSALPALDRTSSRDRRFHQQRANTRAGSRRNIQDHYDLGNEFYRLWLDQGLSYSSGIYTRPDSSLEDAQAEKHRRILEALDFAPGQTLLEVGCGWGSLVEAAARAGADVTAITISDRQHEAALRRVDDTGLGKRARIVLQDYRDTGGAFDRVASIEMIEAVGEEHWPAYFRAIHDRLVPGGHAVIQAITIRDDLFEGYKNRPDFIQRYIFPGGMLPTVTSLDEGARAAGLGFSVIERFGPSYARTLDDWRARFHERWPDISALGFDQRFRRLWDYYFCYCAAGFRHRQIDVGLYRLSKPSGIGCPAIENSP